MPTYVYRFVDSNETIEVSQSFTDDALTEAVHPTTGDVRAVKKVFTPVGVTFKGGGFYKTDSRSKSRSTGASAKPSDASDSTTKSSGSPDSSAPAASPSSSGSKDSSSSDSGN